MSKQFSYNILIEFKTFKIIFKISTFKFRCIWISKILFAPALPLSNRFFKEIKLFLFWKMLKIWFLRCTGCAGFWKDIISDCFCGTIVLHPKRNTEILLRTDIVIDRVWDQCSSILVLHYQSFVQNSCSWNISDDCRIMWKELSAICFL